MISLCVKILILSAFAIMVFIEWFFENLSPMWSKKYTNTVQVVIAFCIVRLSSLSKHNMMNPNLQFSAKLLFPLFRMGRAPVDLVAAAKVANKLDDPVKSAEYLENSKKRKADPLRMINELQLSSSSWFWWRRFKRHSTCGWQPWRESIFVGCLGKLPILLVESLSGKYLL